MNKIEQIKAEIERLKNENGQYRASCVTLVVIKACAKDEAYNEVLSFIDSLPEEQPSEDLEVAAEKYAEENTEEEYHTDEGVIQTYGIANDAFIAGAQWQYQKDRREFAKIKAKTWCEGFDAHKEQMMKEAVEGEIAKSYSGRLVPSTPYSLDGNKYHFGDKVKIIIVKEN